MYCIGVYGVEVDLWLEFDWVRICVIICIIDFIGVEMEVFIVVMVVVFIVVDMVKGVDCGFVIEYVVIIYKVGGCSGEWIRSDD